MQKLALYFVLLNILALDFVVVYKFYLQSNEPVVSYKNETVQKLEDSCGENCMKYIDSKLDSLTSVTPISISPTPTIKQAISVPKIKMASYIPIPGNGETLSTSWTDIAGTDFYIDKKDYQSLVDARLEVNLHLKNGNGKAFVRLYDATNNRGVDGSEVSTSEQTPTFVSSGALSIWSGTIHYKIQAKSLTADTTVFDSGRLKLTTEN